MRISLAIVLLLLSVVFGAVSYIGVTDMRELSVRATDPFNMQVAEAADAAANAYARATVGMGNTYERASLQVRHVASRLQEAARVTWEIYTESLARSYVSSVKTAVSTAAEAINREHAVMTGAVARLSQAGAHLIYGVGKTSTAAVGNARGAAALMGSAGATIHAGVDAARTWAIDARKGFENAFSGTAHTKRVCVERSDGTETCVNGDELEALLKDE